MNIGSMNLSSFPEWVGSPVSCRVPDSHGSGLPTERLPPPACVPGPRGRQGWSLFKPQCFATNVDGEGSFITSILSVNTRKLSERLKNVPDPSH